MAAQVLTNYQGGDEADTFRIFDRKSLATLQENQIRYRGRKATAAAEKHSEAKETIIDALSDPQPAPEEEMIPSSPDPGFEDGQQLPDGMIPKNLINCPLEDFDPYYIKKGIKTFCVAARKFGKKHVYRFSATNSLFIFSPFNPLRYWSIRTILHPGFDAFIITVILINCVFLALDNEVEEAEYVFTAIYTLEMIVKIIARGFVLHPFSYLRDPWNWLDFAVVILAYITFTGFANVSGLRAFRVLRAFRSVSIVPGLKIIINALIHSLRPLGEVLLIMLFLLMVLGLIALQAYQGVLRRRCVSVPSPGIITSDLAWSTYVTNSSNWNPVDGELIVCGNSSGSGFCPTNYVCLNDVGNNPNFGYTGFDNMGLSLLTSFQLITLDFWENVYNMILRAEGPWNILFFLISVFLGPFYLLNLLLAVITLAYCKEQDEQKEMEENRKIAQERALKQKKSRKQHRMNAVSPNVQAETETSFVASNDYVASDQLVDGSNQQLDNAAVRRLKFQTKQQSGSMDSNYSSTKRKKSKWLQRMEKFQNWFTQTFCCWRCSPFVSDVQTLLYKVVDHKVFEGFIMSSIVANTIFLAIDHFGASAALVEVLRVSNVVFTLIFTVEAVVKILALGPIDYGLDPWNDFDFLIVVISWVELGITLSGGEGTNTGLTVLRTLRLLRVFRLARMWGTMAKLVEIIGKTVGAVVYLSIVLFLVLYIFAVIGKQLFGDRYRTSASSFEDNHVPRWNFVDFYHAFLLVWRVMCGEWIEPLYECLHITGGDGVCIVVFLIVFLISNFMILNLFTAILLSAFSVDSLKKGKEDKEKEKRKRVLMLKVIDAFKVHRKSKITSNAVGPQTETDGAKAEESPRSKQNGNGMNWFPRRTVSPSRAKQIAEIRKIVQNQRRHSKMRSQTEISESTLDEPEVKRLQNLRVQRNWLLSAQRVLEQGGREMHHVISNPAANSHEPPSDERHVMGNGDVHHRRLSLATTDTILDYRIFSKLYCCCYIPGSVQEEFVRAPPPHHAPVEPVPEVNPAGDVNVTTTTVEENPQESGQNDDESEVIPHCFPTPLRNRYPFLSRPVDSPVFNYWLLIRKACFILVNHPYFDYFILLLILGSTITLAMEDINLDRDPVRKQVIEHLEYVFTALFTLEMLLKWIGIGLTDYLTNPWSLLDCIIVAISWAGVVLDATNQGGQTGAFRSLRTLRALRPLRAVSRWEGMKVVVNSLIYCIPSIGNVLLVCLLIWFVFAIMGVQLFKGKFFRCIDQNGDVFPSTTIPTKSQCMLQNQTWINPHMNFDNVFIAMVALFQVATFEGWLEVMADASDITDVDLQPRRENSQYNLIFFVIFVLIGSFFILNLIVGVIIESFQNLRKQTESSSSMETFMTESQKQFYKTMKTMMNNKPKQRIPEPKNRIQLFVYNLVTHSGFELAIFILICLNMITLSMEHYQMSQEWVDALRIIDMIFTALFGIEAIMKIFGMRQYYFKDPFNNFDFFVVLVSIAGFILESVISTVVSPTLLRIVRVFRVFRVLRVIRAAKGIRRLILTLLVSVPALFNIAVLLTVFLVIFAILGMNLFQHVAFNNGLNDLVNFQTFINSMFLLFRLVTSAGWNEILDPLMNTRNCTPATPNNPGNCGDPVAAIIYFIIFIFLMFLVIVNMYIAVILDNFEEILQQDESGISLGDFEEFYSVWARYDPKATQLVTLKRLPDLLHDLRPPFQIPKPNQFKISALELPVRQGDCVHCLDVLFALVKRILGDVEISDTLKEEAENLLSKYFPKLKNLETQTTTLILAQRTRAAKKIQGYWRHYQRRKNNQDDPVEEQPFLKQLMKNMVSSRTATTHANVELTPDPEEEIQHPNKVSTPETKVREPKSKTPGSKPDDPRFEADRTATVDTSNNNNKVNVKATKKVVTNENPRFEADRTATVDTSNNNNKVNVKATKKVVTNENPRFEADRTATVDTSNNNNKVNVKATKKVVTNENPRFEADRTATVDTSNNNNKVNVKATIKKIVTNAPSKQNVTIDEEAVVIENPNVSEPKDNLKQNITVQVSRPKTAGDVLTSATAPVRQPQSVPEAKLDSDERGGSAGGGAKKPIPKSAGPLKTGNPLPHATQLQNFVVENKRAPNPPQSNDRVK